MSIIVWYLVFSWPLLQPSSQGEKGGNTKCLDVRGKVSLLHNVVLENGVTKEKTNERERVGGC